MSVDRTTIEGPQRGPFLCIVNPNSGTGASRKFIETIDSRPAVDGLNVIISESPAHSRYMAKSAEENGYKAVIAVGGDGSVQEIATQLIGSKVAFGIVPAGSGNGIARHLNISMNPEEALQQMLQGKQRVIDTFKVNETAAIGFSGLGLDGLVAKAFDEANERGFSNYVKLTMDLMLGYQATRFRISDAEGNDANIEALSIVCANTSQLGNNAVVNATGKDDDGALELVIIQNTPPVQRMALASRLFLRSLHKSPVVEVKQSSRFVIENLDSVALQVDGETSGSPSMVTFEVVPKSLNVLIP